MSLFRFKQFEVKQDKTAMKVGTDGVLLGAWAMVDHTSPKILDIGTGTGIIALMQAQKNEHAIIDAIDLDEQAYLQATENVNNSKWAARIQVVHTSLVNWNIGKNECYNMIICNPPYFIKGWDVADPGRQKARDAAHLPYEDIIAAAKTLLVSTGSLFLILPIVEGAHFLKLAAAANLFCVKQTTVFTKAGLPAKRCLLQISQIEGNCMHNQLIIADAENNYTDDYKGLTADYYLNF